jgi:hypothetical protein
MLAPRSAVLLVWPLRAYIMGFGEQKFIKSMYYYAFLSHNLIFIAIASG